MQDWHLWIIAAIGFALAELLGAEFVLLGFAAAALIGAAVAGLTAAGVSAQITAAAIAAIIIVPAFVFAFRLWVRPPHGYGVIGSGAEAGTEVEVITLDDGSVGVVINGDRLRARLEGGGVPLPGERVRIERIEGISAIVRPLPDQQPNNP